MRLFSTGLFVGALFVIAPPASAATLTASGTVEAFHAALARGDTTGAAALLSDDALIFEQGGVERSKAEYSAHHLPADAEFSKSVRSELVKRTERSEGDLAWVGTEGRMKGTFKGKAIDRLSTETMVLRQVAGAWKIVHIHWSGAAAAR